MSNKANLGLLKDKFSYWGNYDFLGQHVLACSDRDLLYKQFDLIHSFFRESTRTAKRVSKIYFSHLKERGLNILTTGEKSYFFDARQAQFDIHFFAVKLILGSNPEYFILHGAALSDGEKGIIICSPSGWGKTTLAIALSLQRLHFLSDEMAPLNRKTGLIHPFPRALGLRQETKKIFPELPSTEGDTICPPQSIPGLSLGRSCPPGKIYFLTPARRKCASDRKIMLVGLSRVCDEFLGDIEKLSGVGRVVPAADWGRPVIRIEMNRSARIVSALEKIAIHHSIGFLFTADGDIEPPDYKNKPAIASLGFEEGLKKLPRFIINRSPFLGERPLTSNILISELANLMKEVEFYELHPGKLNSMVELILDTKHTVS